MNIAVINFPVQEGNLVSGEDSLKKSRYFLSVSILFLLSFLNIQNLSASTISIDYFGVLSWNEFYEVWDYDPGWGLIPDPGGVWSHHDSIFTVTSSINEIVPIKIDMAAHFIQSTYESNMNITWNDDYDKYVNFPNISLMPNISNYNGPIISYSKYYINPFIDDVTTYSYFCLYAQIYTNIPYVIKGGYIDMSFPLADASVIDSTKEAYGYADLQASLHLIDISTVPEPSTMLLLGSGLVGLVGHRHRKRIM